MMEFRKDFHKLIFIIQISKLINISFKNQNLTDLTKTNRKNFFYLVKKLNLLLKVKI